MKLLIYATYMSMKKIVKILQLKVGGLMQERLKE